MATPEMIEAGAEMLWKMAYTPGREKPWSSCAAFVQQCLRNEVAAVWATMSALDRGQIETGGAYPPPQSGEPEGSNSSGQSLRSLSGHSESKRDPVEIHNRMCF